MTDDKDKDRVPAGQSEAIAEAPSNDPPEMDAPTPTDGKVLSSQDEGEGILDTTPGAGICTKRIPFSLNVLRIEGSVGR